MKDTDPKGSPGWIVKDVGLYSTTVVYCATNEVASYANGALATYRIINAGRSPRAIVGFPIWFPIDTPYQKIEVYSAALEQFIKARPREWISLSSFRNTTFNQSLRYIEYKVTAQHRGKCTRSTIVSVAAE